MSNKRRQTHARRVRIGGEREGKANAVTPARGRPVGESCHFRVEHRIMRRALHYENNQTRWCLLLRRTMFRHRAFGKWWRLEELLLLRAPSCAP